MVQPHKDQASASLELPLLQSKNDSPLDFTSLIAREKYRLYTTLCDDKEVDQPQSLLASLGGDNFNKEEIIKR